MSFWAKLRGLLSPLLDPAEWEAVSGDFLELAMSERESAKSLLGLVARRQLSHWKAVYPWLAIMAIIVTVSPQLARLSNQLGEGIWPGIVTWLHHGPSNETGLSPAANWARFSWQAMALITWSWTTGFALGKLPKNALRVGAVVFFVGYSLLLTGLAGFFSPIFLWAWLPLDISLLLVVLPGYYGFRHSTGFLNGNLAWTVLLAAWTLFISFLAFWTRGWYQAALDNWSRGRPALTLWQLARDGNGWRAGITDVLSYVILMSPILYVLVKEACSEGVPG